jgi:hypothetical protein
MSSNYNTRPRVAEVMVSGTIHQLVYLNIFYFADHYINIILNINRLFAFIVNTDTAA